MRAVIQRVSRAVVTIDGEVAASIKTGLLVLLGIEDADREEDATWLSGKIARLRIFQDDNGKMSLSVGDVGGELMVVSQFTLHASTRKGNRPSFIRAAIPEQAKPLYGLFISALKNESGVPVKSGEFGAMMQVELVNNGPVTIIIDSKRRE